ncbi:phage major capsid protein, partial [Streptococcus agalactiae]|nr:phage major capsid protein [Streptococcus agalactiae]
VNCSEEKQLSYLKSFIDGLAKKVAQAVDFASFHGLEPKSMTDASFKTTNSFDGLITGNVVTYDAEKIDENIDAVVTTITANDGQV